MSTGPEQQEHTMDLSTENRDALTAIMRGTVTEAETITHIEGELMTDPKLPAVQDLIRRLAGSPVGPTVRWDDRSGGCFAIVIPLADGRQITVTDREDVFGVNDYNSDDEVFGFYVAVNNVDADGTVWADEDGNDYIYCTNEEDGTAAYQAAPGDKVIDLTAEVGYAFEAITEFVAALPE